MVAKIPDREKLVRTIMFLVRLTALSAPLYLIIILDVSLLPLQEAVAGQSMWLLEATGFEVERSGLILVCGAEDPFIFHIGEDCTGWKSMLFFAALVLATLGTTYRKRILGILIGIPLIYVANLARILAVVMIESSWGYDAALFVHDWLWQFGLLAAVLVLWLLWLRWEKVVEAAGRLKKHIIARRER